MSLVVPSDLPQITVEVDMRHLKADEIDRLVKELRATVNDIMEGRKLTRSQFVAALNNVRNACLVGEVSSHVLLDVIIRLNCQKHLEKLDNSHDLLGDYVSLWNDYMKRGETLSKLFRFMDDNYGSSDERNKNVTYIPLNYDEPTSNPIGNSHQLLLKNWADTILAKKDKFAKIILHFVESNKEAEVVEQAEQIEFIAKTFDEIESFKSFNIYKRIIEEPVLEKVCLYFMKAASQHLDSSSILDYLKICNNALTFVEQSIQKKLPRSAASVTDTMWNKMVLSHLDTIVEKTIDCIETKDLETINCAYMCLKYSREAMKNVNRAIDALEECTFFKLLETCEPSKFCESFLKAYSESFGILRTTFCPNSEPYDEIDVVEAPKPKGYANISQLPDMLLNYCDQFMKNKTKHLTESGELEIMLEDISVIFKYLEDRCAFAQLYAQRLATRMIHLSSQSLKAEQMFLEKLKFKFGERYATDVQRMLADVESSNELTSRIEQEIGDHLQMPFRFLAIRTSTWKIRASKTKLLVPRELAVGMQFIKDFVSKDCESKRIDWQYECSTCDIQLNYLSGCYTLQTSMCVTTIMVTFNDKESVTFEEMMTLTGIAEKDLIQYMEILSAYKILTNDETKVTKNSKFRLNYKYENKRKHIKLIPVLVEYAEERASLQTKVETENKFYLQALIVRTMKANLTLTLREIVNEVIRNSRPNFVPKRVSIINVVGDLVQKRFLEIREGTSDTYNYLP